MQAEREGQARLVGRYKVLENAFGKDGVPALLIEQALPMAVYVTHDEVVAMLIGRIGLEERHLNAPPATQ